MVLDKNVYVPKRWIWRVNLISTCTFPQIDVPTSQLTSVDHEISIGKQFQDAKWVLSLNGLVSEFLLPE